MPFDLFGNMGAMPPVLPPKKPMTIDLGFSGLYPGAAKPAAAPTPPTGGFVFKPTDYQNTVTLPNSERNPNEPEPDRDPDDWQIQPRQAAPAQMQPMWTRDEAGGMEPPAPRPGPYTTPDEARGIQARMAGVAPDQMAPSYEKRVYGQDYDANKGPNSAANIILRAKQGDQNASNMLWQMSGQDRTAYVRALETGTLPYQLEDQARNRAWANEDAERNFKFGMADRGMGLEEQKQRAKEEQFKVVQAYQIEKDKLDSALRNRQIDVNQYQAQTDRLKAEAASELQKRSLALQETDPNRQLGQFKVDAVKAANAAAPEGQMSPVTAGLLGLPTANQQESQALDLDLKRAQVAAAQQQIGQQASGGMGPLEMRKSVQAAGNRAQQLLDTDPTMAPDEAQRRAAQEAGVPVERVPLPQMGTTVGAAQHAFQAAGFQNDQEAYKAALATILRTDPKLRQIAEGPAGSIAMDDLTKDPKFLAYVAPQIIRELSTTYSIPPQLAARAVQKYAR